MGWFTKDKKKSPEEEEAEKEKEAIKQQQEQAKEEAKKEKKAAELKKAEEKKAAELKKAEEKRVAEQKKAEDKKKEKEEKKKDKDDKKKGMKNSSGALNDEERKVDDDIQENIAAVRQQQLGNIDPAIIAAAQDQQQPQRLIKEEDVWIYESILQFFVSPTFLTPIGKFTDDKCIFFQTEVDPAPPSYKDTHNEFKSQMDELILSLGTDLGVEPDKIIELCESGLNLRSQKKYFSYMLVYFHYDEFIKAMVHKNMYLQEQAMKQLGKNNKKPKSSEDDFNKAIESSLNATQLVATDKELQKAIMASQQEFEDKKKLQDKEGEMLSEAIKQSKMNAGEIPQEDGKVDGGPRQAAHLSSQKIQKPIQKSNEDDDDLIHIDDSDDEDDNLYVDPKKSSKA